MPPVMPFKAATMQGPTWRVRRASSRHFLCAKQKTMQNSPNGDDWFGLYDHGSAMPTRVGHD